MPINALLTEYVVYNITIIHIRIFVTPMKRLEMRLFDVRSVEIPISKSHAYGYFTFVHFGCETNIAFGDLWSQICASVLIDEYNWQNKCSIYWLLLIFHWVREIIDRCVAIGHDRYEPNEHVRIVIVAMCVRSAVLVDMLPKPLLVENFPRIVSACGCDRTTMKMIKFTLTFLSRWQGWVRSIEFQ